VLPDKFTYNIYEIVFASAPISFGITMPSSGSTNQAYDDIIMTQYFAVKMDALYVHSVGNSNDYVQNAGNVCTRWFKYDRDKL
jgi:hypothetical protein